MPDDITHLLVRSRTGDDRARRQLFEAAYDDLRVIARRQRKRWRGDYTMNTTALVHEFYLKAASNGSLDVENRRHFYNVAARAMRQVLLDYSKGRRRQRRGGGAPKVSLEDAPAAANPDGRPVTELMDLDRALRALEDASMDGREKRLVEVIELHFFAGLTYDEIAELLEVSKKTVARDWKVAQALLQRFMMDPPARRSQP